MAIKEQILANKFEVRYVGAFYVWAVEEVYLVRHRCPFKAEPDDFTCHRASDGIWLGYGETKDDAIGQARYHLMDLARTITDIAPLPDWYTRALATCD